MKQLFFVSILFFLSACNFLDYSEVSHTELEDIYENFNNVEGALTSCYSFLPKAYGTIDGALRSAGCDEAIWFNKLSLVNDFNNGNWSPINTLDDQWSYFSAIRYTNLFLINAQDLKFEELRHNEDYGQMMARFKFFPSEARFLRAYYHFELAKRYGRIPIITKVLTPAEVNELQSEDFDKVVEFICKECDEIVKKLPVSYVNVPRSEHGRITKGAAMALKSRVLLYAASPLFNPSNEVDRWRIAAKASSELISKASSFGYIPLPKLENLKNKNFKENNELILGILEDEHNYLEFQNFPVGIEGAGGTGLCPTQNLVDAFEMSETGLPINDQADYQTADPNYNAQDPYKGRDPRLSATVAVNNENWVYNLPLECWEGGRSGKPTKYASLTGYYLKKYVDGTISLKAHNITKKRHVWMIIRYSEILLNHAEAMIEAHGDMNFKNDDFPLSAKEAVDLVRSREGVNMPPFPASLSVAEFKKKLKNERMVELAFEDHRFWDVRRWKIANETTDIYGVKIVKSGENKFHYEKVLVEKRVFNECNYLYPIPASELVKNKNLIQNSGW